MSFFIIMVYNNINDIAVYKSTLFTFQYHIIHTKLTLYCPILLHKKMHMPLRMCIFFCTFAEKLEDYDIHTPTRSLTLFRIGRNEQSS